MFLWNLYTEGIMKIAIRGASGFIGSAMTRYFKNEEIAVLKRSKDWNLEGQDVLINLAGENIFSRWTHKQKKAIRESRVNTTRALAESLAKCQNPPKVWINASAIGYYGDRGGEEITEASNSGGSFLSRVVEEWEKAAVTNGVRILKIRTGIVLSTEEGALSRMLFPFKMGLGGVIGSGIQYMSWIDIDDLVRATDHLIKMESLEGPVNFTAPHPVPNKEFIKTLGQVLGRPTFFPMPAWVVKLLFGEMGEELLIQGAKVYPKKLLDSGFHFEYSTLDKSLKHLLCKG
jgi:uncharacterized protein (TIGR01777 family)